MPEYNFTCQRSIQCIEIRYRGVALATARDLTHGQSSHRPPSFHRKIVKRVSVWCHAPTTRFDPVHPHERARG
eukprot:3717185-Prymnesium_polylepis.1